MAEQEEQIASISPWRLWQKTDVLVSWNFKHIVNLDRIRGCNGVNLLLGYSQIEILTPKEIERYD